MKSRRSFTFFAPYNEEGERVIEVPFPVPVKRAVVDGGLTHDANPAIVNISPAEDTAIDVDAKAPAGALIIVKNEGEAKATLAGAECLAGETSVLMHAGEGAYIKLYPAAVSGGEDQDQG